MTNETKAVPFLINGFEDIKTIRYETDNNLTFTIIEVFDSRYIDTEVLKTIKCQSYEIKDNMLIITNYLNGKSLKEKWENYIIIKSKNNLYNSQVTLGIDLDGYRETIIAKIKTLELNEKQNQALNDVITALKQIDENQYVHPKNHGIIYENVFRFIIIDYLDRYIINNNKSFIDLVSVAMGNTIATKLNENNNAVLMKLLEQEQSIYRTLATLIYLIDIVIKIQSLNNETQSNNYVKSTIDALLTKPFDLSKIKLNDIDIHNITNINNIVDELSNNQTKSIFNTSLDALNIYIDKNTIGSDDNFENDSENEILANEETIKDINATKPKNTLDNVGSVQHHLKDEEIVDNKKEVVDNQEEINSNKEDKKTNEPISEVNANYNDTNHVLNNNIVTSTITKTIVTTTTSTIKQNDTPILKEIVNTKQTNDLDQVDNATFDSEEDAIANSVDTLNDETNSESDIDIDNDNDNESEDISHTTNDDNHAKQLLDDAKQNETADVIANTKSTKTESFEYSDNKEDRGVKGQAHDENKVNEDDETVDIEDENTDAQLHEIDDSDFMD